MARHVTNLIDAFGDRAIAPVCSRQFLICLAYKEIKTSLL
jgi:hypothetical protein